MVRPVEKADDPEKTSERRAGAVRKLDDVFGLVHLPATRTNVLALDATIKDGRLRTRQGARRGLL
jgi:hypothetical protein